MHRKIPLLIVDLGLIVIIVLVGKNVLVINSEAQDNPITIDKKTEISKTPTIPLLTIVSPKTLAPHINHTPKTSTTPETKKLLDLINSERQSRGLSPLSLNPSLSQVAQNHSQDMATKNYFSHTNQEGKSPFERLSATNISFKSAGENIAYAPSVDIAHNNLMKSEEHKDNILSQNFGKIGIGIAKQSQNKILFTEVFTN